MGDCITVQLLDKLHDFVSEFETAGSRKHVWSRDAFFYAYHDDPSVEWTDKMCTMRAIKFVKTLAICFYHADWSGIRSGDAGESLYEDIQRYLEWLKDKIPNVVECTEDDDDDKVAISSSPLSNSLWGIASLSVIASRIYAEPMKLPLFSDSIALHKFSQSVQQYVMNVPHCHSSVEANYRLTVRQLEYFTCLLSESTILKKSLLSRAGALICSILHLAHKTDVRDMALRLSPCHNPEAMELCAEVLSAEMDPSQDMVESFHNLLQSAQNQVPIPMMYFTFKDLNLDLFSLEINHAKIMHRLNLIKAELFVMAIFHENQAAAFGEALTFFNTSAGNMEDQENVLLKLNIHFLKEAARLLSESGQVSEAMIQHSSLEIFKLCKQESYFMVSRRYRSHFDAPVEKRSFISFRELLSSSLSSKAELNLEEITAVYEQGSLSMFEDFIKSDRVFLADNLMRKLRKLLTNKPDTYSLIKDQLVTLIEELEFLRSILTEGKMEEVGLCVMCVVYEAEYILDMFLHGEAPAWYQQLLIFNAIHETKLIKAKISEYCPDKTTDGDQSKVIVEMLQATSKDLDRPYNFLNGFEDESAKEYWRNYIHETYLCNPSPHWTDKKCTMRATKFLKTIQFFYNTDRCVTDEDKQLVVQCQRRESYFRWLQNEIHECEDPHHLSSALSESFMAFRSFRVKFEDSCNQLMKIPHPELAVDGVVFDELADSVQQFLMKRDYKVSVQMLERFKCSVISFSKHCSDPKSLHSLLVPAVTMVFSILKVARRFEVDTMELEEDIFPSSFDLLRKVLPQNRDAVEVYLEVLSSNVGIIKASKVHAVESESLLNILQSTKKQAQILGEIMEFPAMDLIVDGPNDHMDILLKQGYMVVAREAASLFSSGHPSDHNALTNLLNKLHLIKGKVFVFEVECQKARLTSFGGNRASTIREAFRFFNEFFKMPEANMAEEEKVYLELIQSLLRELSVDEILESSLAVYKLFKAEALFMVLRHSSSSFNILAGFDSEKIQKIALFLRELASGTPNAYVKDAIEETEDLYMRDLWLLYNNFPRSDGTFVAEHIVKKLRKCGTNLPVSMVFLKESFQSLLEMLELFILFLNETSNRSLELRVTFYIYAVEYIVDMMLMLGDGSLGYRQLVFFIAIEEAEFIKANIMEHFHDKKESISLPLQAFQPAFGNERSEESIVGFDDQAKIIADRLQNGWKSLQVVSVVGMAGIGKTTLAKKVYSTNSIQHYFSARGGGSVSQVYRKRELLLDILGDLVEVTDDMKKKDDNDLARAVYQSLKGKRYLIVIDDIWKIEHWEDLRLSFPDDRMGSRILFTTRVLDVALRADPRREPYIIPLLSPEQSWELLHAKLFPNGVSCPDQLLEVGNLIAKNCKGLPLAIVVVAGILKRSTEMNKYEWEAVAEHLRSLIANDQDRQFTGILEFSYNHLPSYLKPCYLYFASFLEDQQIPVKKLKWLWMGEGFVQKEDSKSLEETAEGYLVELMNRSLVMKGKRSFSGGTKTCHIHDMLRDFCLKKAKEENFMQVISSGDSDLTFGKQYRVSVHSHKEMFIQLRPCASHVHSLLFFATNAKHIDSYDLSFISDDFKLLRVLEMESITSRMFPKGIELMLGLTYLAIKGNVESIPSEIENIWSLETLIVKGTRGEIRLPGTLWSMGTLRHVHIRPRARLEIWYPDKILENLTTFSSPTWFDGCAWRMPRLKKLRCIFWVVQTDVEGLTQLESLYISFIRKIAFSSELRLPLNIKKLALSKSFLPWAYMSVISSLPNLKVLKLLFNAFEGDTWEMTEETRLPNLACLMLESLNLSNWTSSMDCSDHFPQLQTLVLKSCKKLVEVPSSFGTLDTLERIEVHLCSQSATDSVREIIDLKVEFGCEDFKVIITPPERDFRRSSH